MSLIMITEYRLFDNQFTLSLSMPTSNYSLAPTAI